MNRLVLFLLALSATLASGFVYFDPNGKMFDLAPDNNNDRTFMNDVFVSSEENTDESDGESSFASSNSDSETFDGMDDVSYLYGNSDDVSNYSTGESGDDTYNTETADELLRHHHHHHSSPRSSDGMNKGDYDDM